MQFCDLNKQYKKYKKEIDTAMQDVLNKSAYIGGPVIDEMENSLSQWSGAKHTIAVSSGSDAISMALLALGIGPGDEVIVPAFTFIATASMVSIVGAKPVFADIDPVTFNISPNEIKKKITKKTKAIMPVSLYGQCADFDEITAIAKEFNLIVIEDGAQSFGATYKNKKSCAITPVATTSFFPAKPLGCYGDGGAIFVESKELKDLLLQIRNHGQTKRYEHGIIGVNGRMDAIQAAVINVKLRHFSEELVMRQEVADTYTQYLKDVVDTPKILSHNTSAWAQYTIRHPQRDKIAATCAENQIPTAIHYPKPLTSQEAFLKSDPKLQKQKFPISDSLSKNVISLPMHPFLAKKDIKLICDTVKKALA